MYVTKRRIYPIPAWLACSHCRLERVFVAREQCHGNKSRPTHIGELSPVHSTQFIKSAECPRPITLCDGTRDIVELNRVASAERANKFANFPFDFFGRRDGWFYCDARQHSQLTAM